MIAPGSPDDYRVTSARSTALANVAAAMVADRERHIDEAGLVALGALVALCRISTDPNRAFCTAIDALKQAMGAIHHEDTL